MKMKKKPAQEMTLTGFVAATEWDDDDNIIGLEISTDDEDYVVEKNRLWEELVELWQEDVEVTGTVTEERDGTKHITVSNYEVISDFDDEDDPVPGGYDDLDQDFDDEDDEDEDEISYH